jgi:Notch-like protein
MWYSYPFSVLFSLKYLDIDDCENQSCMHDGTCIDKVNNYTCQCIPGYTGVNCETGKV